MAPLDGEGICDHLHGLAPVGIGNEVGARERTAMLGHSVAVKAANEKSQ